MTRSAGRLRTPPSAAARKTESPLKSRRSLLRIAGAVRSSPTSMSSRHLAAWRPGPVRRARAARVGPPRASTRSSSHPPSAQRPSKTQGALAREASRAPPTCAKRLPSRNTAPGRRPRSAGRGRATALRPRCTCEASRAPQGARRSRPLAVSDRVPAARSRPPGLVTGKASTRASPRTARRPRAARGSAAACRRPAGTCQALATRRPLAAEEVTAQQVTASGSVGHGGLSPRATGSRVPRQRGPPHCDKAVAAVARRARVDSDRRKRPGSPQSPQGPPGRAASSRDRRPGPGGRRARVGRQRSVARPDGGRRILRRRPVSAASDPWLRHDTGRVTPRRPSPRPGFGFTVAAGLGRGPARRFRARCVGGAGPQPREKRNPPAVGTANSHPALVARRRHGEIRPSRPGPGEGRGHTAERRPQPIKPRKLADRTHSGSGVGSNGSSRRRRPPGGPPAWRRPGNGGVQQHRRSTRGGRSVRPPTLSDPVPPRLGSGFRGEAAAWLAVAVGRRAASRGPRRPRRVHGRRGLPAAGVNGGGPSLRTRAECSLSPASTATIFRWRVLLWRFE